MKIVITGSAGFIGGELVKKMNHLGYEDIIMIDQPDLLRTKDDVFSDFIDYNELLTPKDFSFLDKGVYLISVAGHYKNIKVVKQ